MEILEFACSHVNGIGELHTFDFSKNHTYKATTHLEPYTHN